MQDSVVLRQQASPLNWTTVVGVSVFHILAIASLFYFSWANLIAALVMWWIAGSWGVGMGYHRYLTHRGFKAPKWLDYFMSICGTLAMQSGPLSWVATHRIHHAFTETDKDPHSPHGGTYWAHIGWIFRGTAQNQSEATIQRYCPDFANDPVHKFINKYYWVSSVIVAIPLYFIGGVPMILWAIFLRVVFGWHNTWLVNSATHLWGKRRFETRDDSRNNGFIAALTFGEGWHNNHHAYPRSAKHGLGWYEFDVNWVQIRILEKLGIISDVYAYSEKKKKASNEALKSLEPIHETV